MILLRKTYYKGEILHMDLNKEATMESQLEELGLEIVDEEETRHLIINKGFDDDLVNAVYEFVSQLIEYDLEEQPPIHIHISSPGGDANSLFAILDILSRVKAPIYTYSNGLCASAALGLFVIGDKRFGGEYCDYMYHSVQYTVPESSNTFDHRKISKDMDKLTKKYNSIFIKHTKLTESDLKKHYKDDWWFDKETAMKYGVATE